MWGIPSVESTISARVSQTSTSLSSSQLSSLMSLNVGCHHVPCVLKWFNRQFAVFLDDRVADIPTWVQEDDYHVQHGLFYALGIRIYSIWLDKMRDEMFFMSWSQYFYSRREALSWPNKIRPLCIRHRMSFLMSEFRPNHVRLQPRYLGDNFPALHTCMAVVLTAIHSWVVGCSSII
jgi:hypothetical protein